MAHGLAVEAPEVERAGGKAIPSVSIPAGILALASVVLGGVIWRRGARSRALFMGSLGFVAGAMALGSVAGAWIDEPGASLLGGLVGGVFGAPFAIAYRRVGVFLAGAVLGMALPFALSHGEIAAGFLVWSSVVSGAVALAFNQHAVIVSSSFAGATAIVLGASFLVAPGGIDFSSFVWYGDIDVTALDRVFYWAQIGDGADHFRLAAWILLWFVGTLVQYQLDGTAARSTVASSRSAEAPESAPPARSPAMAAGSVTPASKNRATVQRSAAPEPSSAASESDASPIGQPSVVASVVDDDTPSVSPSDRMRATRGRLGQGVEELQREIDALVASSGPDLAAWNGAVWERWDERALSAGIAANGGLRLGDVRLPAGDVTLHVPAVVNPTRVGALVVAGAADRESVRDAFLGWCARLLAVSGAGRVAVEWFEDREPVGVPAAWRAAARVGLLGRYAVLLRTDERPSGDDVRRVLVAVGAAADRLPIGQAWPGQRAVHGVAADVNLLLAPSLPVDIDGEGVLQLAATGDGKAFRWVGGVLDQHEVLLQAAPPPALIARLADWSLATRLPKEPEDRRGNMRAAKGAPHTEPASTPPKPVTPVTTPDHWERRLRALLASAPCQRPLLRLGVDEREQPVEIGLAQPVFLRGGSAEAAAALMASFLVEIAAQTRANEWEFVVLDFSDDTGVPDRFDAVLDAPPHLVEFVDGIAATLRLDDVVEQLTGARGERPQLCVFVMGNAQQPLPDAFDDVLRACPDAGVAVCAWTHVDGPTTPHTVAGRAMVTLGERPSLRIDGQPNRYVHVPPAVTTSDVAAIAIELQRTRG